MDPNEHLRGCRSAWTNRLPGKTRSWHNDRPSAKEAADLLGQLARELSALVRRDVDVSAAEQLPAFRRALLNFAAFAAVAAAAVFALAAVSVAAGKLIATAVPARAAGLVIAACWSLIAYRAHRRSAASTRPAARAREGVRLAADACARRQPRAAARFARARARDEAEQEATAGTLVQTGLDEAAEHQLKAFPRVAKREAERAEADAADVVAEALSILTAPARAGLRALERLVEPGPPQVRLRSVVGAGTARARRNDGRGLRPPQRVGVDLARSYAFAGACSSRSADWPLRSSRLRSASALTSAPSNSATALSHSHVSITTTAASEPHVLLYDPNLLA